MSIRDFKGKVAVITGAGSGFGHEFARLGAELGMSLVLADVQAEALQAVAAWPEGLHAEFGAPFEKVRSASESHQTPWGSEQEFVYCYCRRTRS